MLGFLRFGTAKPSIGSALQGIRCVHATMRVPTYLRGRTPCGLPPS